MPNAVYTAGLFLMSYRVWVLAPLPLVLKSAIDKLDYDHFLWGQTPFSACKEENADHATSPRDDVFYYPRGFEDIFFFLMRAG